MEYNCEKSGHVGKVLEWEYNLIDGNVIQSVSLWGCLKCEKTSTTVWEDFGEYSLDKEPCSEDCDCFGCKARTLQLSTGDANSKSFMSKNKYNKEMDAYKEARRQGIQPGGTTMQKIEAAHKASEALGKPYNGNSMPSAEKITPTLAKTMNELGA